MKIVPLRTVVITRRSHPQAIDNRNDYLLVIAPDANAYGIFTICEDRFRTVAPRF